MTPELGGIVELANPCTNSAQMGNQALIAEAIEATKQTEFNKEIAVGDRVSSILPLLRQREDAILKFGPVKKRVFISILKK